MIEEAREDLEAIITHSWTYGDDKWEVISSEAPPDKHKWVNAHHRMAKSMIDRIEGRAYG